MPIVLDERKRKILRAIINDYIADAEPVGSRTIAKKHNLGISSATVRNEMADLEVMGYLEQPHASSGRVPSAKGYRFYVDCLMSPPKMSQKDIDVINTWYQSKVRQVEEIFRETTQILSRITSNISLVLAPQVSQCVFKYLQFLPLDERRAIVVIVTDAGLIENKILEIPNELSREDLGRIAAAINTRMSGLPLDVIQSGALKEEIKKNILADPALFEAALALLKQALVTEKKPKLYLGGTAQVLNQPEFRDLDKVKGLLKMLEEEKLLCDILHIDNNSDGVVVTIGQESQFTGVHDCSVVKATYRIEGKVVGAVAVLGPTRMEYGKVMTVLEFMHRHLGEILSKYKLG